MNYDDFFRACFKEEHNNFAPYDYQHKLGEEPWPELLDVPTGMGKTAAVTLAWLWKRGWRNGHREQEILHGTPRRLIWCLPMRVLVEQTEENIRGWLQSLGILGNAGDGKVSVHVLMGGSDDLKTWAEHPEEDMILIGTQDMLLSRALLRGYGMSRYQWPIHFSLLHNDCLWVFDEVQLMGAGLATSTQLEAFRRNFPLAKGSRSLWISATLNKDWLATVDFSPHIDSLATLRIGNEDRQQAAERLNAVKDISQLNVSLNKETGNKAGLKTHLEAVRDAVLEAHDSASQTLIVVNRVERAQELFRLIAKERDGKPDLLIHGRFRAAEREQQSQRLHDPSADRIIIATQAIEAGVDISSKVLFTELAPWSSLVQRFGRCNRYGEHNNDGARILWMDIEGDADALPYTHQELASARGKLNGLSSASPQNLPVTDAARPITAVLRRKDLLDLFNTDSDLSGFDVDVSDYIRDSDTPGVQVFWRVFDDPIQPDLQPAPDRSELCPVSISQIKDFCKKREAWYWDSLDGVWARLNRSPRPGMTLLLRSADGGYNTATGFDASINKPSVPVVTIDNLGKQGDYSGDSLSRQKKPVMLPDHLRHVAEQADKLCTAVDSVHKDNIVRAGRWHDLGKTHVVFNNTMHSCEKAPKGFLAKSPCGGRHSRPYFRHELASMLAWLEQHDGEPSADLIAYLILAHHGKVRMSLRSMPDEYEKYPEDKKPTAKRFARGVWEGDVLPALDFDGEHSNEVTLKLALMEMGEGEQGESWTERTLKLLDAHGPFQLAWLETLVRLADWRASAVEQESDKGERA